jgi:Fe-Mn family superoxide dismutase
LNLHTIEPVPTATQVEHLHQLPPLPYAMGALEPCIDARTMLIHHDIHHAGYVKMLNAALAGSPDLHRASALWLLCNLNQVPGQSRVAVHHAAGGHVNHSLFWQCMSADTNAELPTRLREALRHAFGSVETFKAEFEHAGAKHFGSGWVWLVGSPQSTGKLEIITTAGHDHPAMKGLVPLLLNDLWEHAYYLRYENRRADYLKRWWKVVDWKAVAFRLDQIGRGDEYA